MKSTSVWLPSSHQQNHQPLTQHLKDEVVVIGGSFTGLVTALNLLKEGHSVSLLEARTVGLAASRSAGVLASSLERDFVDYVKTYGFETAKRLWSFSVIGVEAVKELASSLAVPTDNSGSLYVSYPEDAAYIQKEGEERRKAGFECEYFEDLNNPLYADGASLGLLTPSDGLVDPYQLCVAIARQAVTRGLKIYEHSPVQSLDSKRGICKTALGSITGDKVILSGQSIPGQFGFKTNNISLLSFCLATEPLSKSKIKQLGLKNRSGFWDADLPFFYGRLTPTNQLLLGGDDLWAPMKSFGLDQAKLNRLEERMRQRIPLLKDTALTHKWSGELTVTSDALPTVGQEGNIYLGGNCAGISQAVMVGVILSKMVGNYKNDFEDIIRSDRSISFFPKLASSKELFHLVLEVLGLI